MISLHFLTFSTPPATLARLALRFRTTPAQFNSHFPFNRRFRALFTMASSLAPPPGQSAAVQPGRIRVLKEGSAKQMGPVVYWMFRDQRHRDNWALIHAVDQANKRNVPVAVAFNLFDQFLGAKARQLGFMLKGLRQVQVDIEEKLQIPFFLFRGEAEENVPKFLEECGASLLVTDFSPLREIRKCKEEILKRVSDSVTIHEVDAHNVVPLWVASEKLEYSARTIRTKITKRLPEYLIDFPVLLPPKAKWVAAKDQTAVDWDNIILEVLRKGAEVPEIEWCIPGEDAAMEVLMGSKDGFLTKRLKLYSSDRNNPLKPEGLSGLSPYLHFGQISAQRCALESHKVKLRSPQSVDAFLEELIVRRELADNYCYYQPHYDSLAGAWEWARKTLQDHATDKREHVYSCVPFLSVLCFMLSQLADFLILAIDTELNINRLEQLEKAKTSDPVSWLCPYHIATVSFLFVLLDFILICALKLQLWNASQLEMVVYGKMHGFMRQATSSFFIIL
ncbi:unnamed protein product [Linum tenue]|uniref:Photolyase/cryptochrome alpha/beta domain-containing protein n=1 Tax=Linum tenue TaxID=586396 RepID=A0AAV0JXZ2_9ROSI|nr:unnamed protein product [Linum tenue]